MQHRIKQPDLLHRPSSLRSWHTKDSSFAEKQAVSARAPARRTERPGGVGAGEVEPGGQHDGFAVERRQLEQRGAHLLVLDALRRVRPGDPRLAIEQRVQRTGPSVAAPSVRQHPARDADQPAEPDAAQDVALARQAIAYVSATASSAYSRDAIDRA